ncbi:O-acyltransferase like protein [Calliopsis andreniformis]|uniref:O-acyltransferase like protein n=1 Tax=Calliopsis andreniformis TaxID=337506 RepID=UPI003FCC50B1
MRSIAFNRVSVVARLSSALPLLLLPLLGYAGMQPRVAAAEKPETVLLDFLAKPFAPSDGASDQCLRDSAIYLKEIARYTPWALQMYDASVKIPSGVIMGNYKQLGNYDECLQVKSGHGFNGKACSAMVQFDITNDTGERQERDLGDLFLNVAIASGVKWTSGKTLIYEWMWCVPSSCSHTEIQEALEIVLDPLKVEGRVDMVVNISESSCHTAETNQLVFDLTDWIYISILAIFAAIIIASTSYDIAKRGPPGTPKHRKHTLLTSFSVYTNGRNLLRTKRPLDSIKCLDGLRYISMCWIIYGHTYYCEVVGVKMNLSEIPRMHENWANLLVLNANIVTDTFFLLSGILLAYTTLIKNKNDSKGRFDVIGLYLHRYVRLTPAYAMMIGFYATLFYKVGSGPRWNVWVGENRDYCRENWWTNLLYVNNYVNLPRICLSQSWYLAMDMQLVWLSPIFLYPMLKLTREIFFWLVFAFGLVISLLVPFLITFNLELTGTMLYYKDPTAVADVYVQIYTRIYSRYGAYIIGLALGYILYKNRMRSNQEVKIRPIYVTLGWLIAIVSGYMVVVGPRWMYFDDHPYNKLEASFYAGFHRQVFVFSLSWIIYCCVNGYAGFLGQCLSWEGWVPFSKLTYSAYLCHYVFLLTVAGSERTPGIVSAMSIFRSFCSNLCLTMILSVLWSLCFEMPFMTLDRMLFSYRNSQSNLSSKSNQENLFGSTDSRKEFYESKEESSTSIVPSFDESFKRKSSGDSVYDSAGNVSYQQGIYDSNFTQDLSRSKDDTCLFNYTIDKSKVQNVHRNNGYDPDSEDAPQSKVEIKLTRNYESMLNENSNRTDGFTSAANKLNGS